MRSLRRKPPAGAEAISEPAPSTLGPAENTLRERRWLARQARAIRTSELFDSAWYRQHWPRDTDPSRDPVEHYLVHGARQGLDPSPNFCGDAYWQANPDVATAGLNPLAHYLLHGRAEGRPLTVGQTSPSHDAALPSHARRLLNWAAWLLRPVLRPRRVMRPDPPEGFDDTAPLRPLDGRPPTGWAVLEIASGARPQPVSLRVAVHGSLREIGLSLGGRGSGTLVRLPDCPAQLGLSCGLRSGAAVAAMLPDRIVLREIGRLEALLRLATSHGPASLLNALRARGWRRLLSELAAERAPTEATGYQHWIDLYDTPTRAQVAAMRARATAMREPPRFSVVVPTYETAAVPLMEMIASVRRQIYPHWQLCLADDASRAPHVRNILQAAAAEDSRIRLALRDRNGNIAAASNSALALADANFAALLDHDDVLSPHALLTMAEAIKANPRADLLYSDEDKLDPQGHRYGPYFKPDYSPELMRGQNLISHLGVYRLSVVRELGGFREGFEGSQDYDLALRTAAHSRAPIVHVPHILYHWRVWDGAATFSSTQIERAVLAARRAVREQGQSLRDPVEVADGPAHYHRAIRALPDPLPLVSAIVPTRDHADVLRDCISGLLEHTDYPALEIIVVDNDSVEPETRAYLAEIARRGVRVLRHPGQFNYSAINNAAARQAKGEILLLLNSDISMLDPGWLREMVSHAARPDVGAVGARLLYPDGTVQHAGVVLGMGGVAGHLHLGAARGDPGYFGQLLLAREASAVTGACLAAARRAFFAVGGLDEVNLPVAFNDVDLCLRLRAAGLRVIWTPHAELLHHESKSRGSDFTPQRLEAFKAEVAYMESRWASELRADPFFNQNLSLDAQTPTIAYPPRGKPIFESLSETVEAALPVFAPAARRQESVH